MYPPAQKPGHAARIARELAPRAGSGTQEPTSTVAVLGGNSVVGRALGLLLRGAGYDVRLLGQPGDGELSGLLEGAHLLLLAPTMNAASTRAILAELRGVAALAALPVLRLAMVPVGNADEPAGIRRVPWPCRTADLVGEIEAALPRTRPA